MNTTSFHLEFVSFYCFIFLLFSQAENHQIKERFPASFYGVGRNEQLVRKVMTERDRNLVRSGLRGWLFKGFYRV